MAAAGGKDFYVKVGSEGYTFFFFNKPSLLLISFSFVF